MNQEEVARALDSAVREATRCEQESVGFRKDLMNPHKELKTSQQRLAEQFESRCAAALALAEDCEELRNPALRE